MKIEKIAENKIRILINEEEFNPSSFKKNELMFSTPEFKKFFLSALDKAEKEVNFNVDGCKLLIELFYLNIDKYIFTVTKYSENKSKLHIYKFNNLDNYYDFCNYIKLSNINIKSLFNNSILYYYNNTYYLIIKNYNSSSRFINVFKNSIHEFSTELSFTDSFEQKLIEHGRIIIKKNAINIASRYF